MSDFANSPLSIIKGDVLLNKDGQKSCIESLLGKTDWVMLLFSASWCGPCVAFKPKLKQFYKKYKDEGKEFEIIFVSSDRDQESCDKNYDDQPWMLLDYKERTMKTDLSKNLVGIPTLVIFDGKTGQLYTKDGRAVVNSVESFEGIKTFVDDQNRKVKEEEDIYQKLCDNATNRLDFIKGNDTILVHSDNDTDTIPVSADSLKGKVIGMYFSGHWCPPCRMFTPKLVEKYNAIKKDGHDFDILFISEDRSESEALSYWDEMPWKMLKFNQNEAAGNLAKVFKLQSIPTLVLLNEKGELLTKNGRDVLFSKNFEDILNYKGD